MRLSLILATPRDLAFPGPAAARQFAASLLHAA